MQLKSLVPVSEYSWNGTARYMVHPKSKFGGYALKFQAMIDRAILNSDRDVLRRIMTTEPDFIELETLRNDQLKNDILKSIRRRERSVYGITIPERTVSAVEDGGVRIIDIFSRTNIVLRVAAGREMRPYVVDYVEHNFPREIELARIIA